MCIWSFILGHSGIECISLDISFIRDHVVYSGEMERFDKYS